MPPFYLYFNASSMHRMMAVADTFFATQTRSEESLARENTQIRSLYRFTIGPRPPA